MSDESEGVRRFDATPAALVVAGEFQFGTYAEPIARVNPLDAVPAAARALYALRLKEWQAFQVMDPERFIVGAVYATKIVDLLQVAVVEKRTGRLRKWQRKVLPGKLTIAQGLDGTASSGTSGGMSITVTNAVANGEIRVDARGRAIGELPDVRLNVVGRCAPGDAGHLVICHPFAHGRALYSHKCIMPAGGTLEIDAQPSTFAADRTVLILDDHKGFYPVPMAYDWVTAAARDASGRVVGFNLTANQIRDPERYNENALWVGTTVERLGAVSFERAHGVYGTWRIRDREGRVDVRFAPSVRNEVHVGPARIVAEYYGPFGWFDGSIARADGEHVDLDGFFGMGEQKRIRM